MELRALFGTIFRWSWLIILVVVVTLAALLVRQKVNGPSYEAVVRLQSPSRTVEDAAVFREIVFGNSVARQTAEQLGLVGDEAIYDLDVRSDVDTGLISISVRAPAPSLAADIANTHASLAIAAFEGLRFGSTVSELQALEEQLLIAEEDILVAEKAQSDFSAEHNIASMDQKLFQYERMLAQVLTERDQRLMDQAKGTEIAAALEEVNQMIADNQQEGDRLAALVAPYHLLEEQAKAKRTALERLLNQAERNPSTASRQEISEAEGEMRAADEALAQFQIEQGFTDLGKELSAQQRLREQLLVERGKLLLDQASIPDDPVGKLDELLALRQKELEDLAALQATYSLLNQKAEQARAEYSDIRRKLTQLEILLNATEIGDPVVIVDQAQAPSKPATDPTRLLVIGAITSLALGILLAFALESIFPSMKAVKTTSAPVQRKPASPGQKKTQAHDVSSQSGPTEAGAP